LVGRSEDALRNYLQSASILETMPDASPGILANNYLNTAIVFMEINELIKADEYYRKSEQIYKSTDDIAGLAHLYTNMGVMFFDINLDSSLYYHSTALDFYKSVEKSINVGVSQSFVADIFREKGDFDTALNYYSEAIKILQTESYIYGEAVAQTGLGILYRLMQNYQQSIQALKKAFDLATSIDALNLQMNSSRELYETYAEMKLFKEAFAYSVLYKELSDSVLNMEKLNIIKSLEFSFESEKKQRHIEHLTAEAKLFQLKMMLFSATAFIILFSLLVFINRQRIIRKNEKRISEEKLKATELELELRKKILLNYALRVTEKNNLLSEISVQLKEMGLSGKKEMSQIFSSIRLNLLLPGEREELDSLIDQTGAAFFAKIEHVSSNLTEAEKRVCVFLSFGFSSKDISGIMNISPKTVDNYRSSIRKKLSISDDLSLSNYFASL